MDKINPLFTATATASGGRNGRTESEDGMVKADLSVPKAMGGPGKPGTATPEHLFAAGIGNLGEDHRDHDQQRQQACGREQDQAIPQRQASRQIRHSVGGRR